MLSSKYCDALLSCVRRAAQDVGHPDTAVEHACAALMMHVEGKGKKGQQVWAKKTVAQKIAKWAAVSPSAAPPPSPSYSPSASPSASPSPSDGGGDYVNEESVTPSAEHVTVNSTAANSPGRRVLTPEPVTAPMVVPSRAIILDE